VPSPRLNAELLLADVLGLPARLELLLEPDRKLSEAQRAAYREYVRRRLDREPTAHIIGGWAFYKRDFRLSAEVLTPRSETEILADAAVSWARKNGAKLALDLGTGSGCLAVTLALEVPGISVVATDVSGKALEVARANAMRLKAAERIEFRAGDLFAALGPEARVFDLVVSNPPYISTAEIAKLMPEVSKWEPHLALDGGADGLDFYRRLAADCAKRLRPGGAVFLEIGAGQGRAVRELFAAAGGHEGIEVSKDLAGLDRVFFATKQRT
jgi:release factor glutamine methyltransferase